MCLADIFIFRSTWSSITSITCRHYQPETTLQEILEVSFSTPWCEFRWQARVTAPQGYKWSWAQPKSCSFNPVSTLPKVERTPRPPRHGGRAAPCPMLPYEPQHKLWVSKSWQLPLWEPKLLWHCLIWPVRSLILNCFQPSADSFCLSSSAIYFKTINPAFFLKWFPLGGYET